MSSFLEEVFVQYLFPMHFNFELNVITCITDVQ